jgi:hypothetical protein
VAVDVTPLCVCVSPHIDPGAAARVHTCKQDAAAAHAGGDPFQAHMKAADKEEMLRIDHEVEEALNSPRPSHEVLDKLLTVKACPCVSRVCAA